MEEEADQKTMEEEVDQKKKRCPAIEEKMSLQIKRSRVRSWMQ
jgi:hypothetical protein